MKFIMMIVSWLLSNVMVDVQLWVEVGEADGDLWSERDEGCVSSRRDMWRAMVQLLIWNCIT